MKRAVALAALLIAPSVCCAQATADDAAAVRAKLREAGGGITSFQVRLAMQLPATAPAGPVHADGTITFVRPGSMKSTISVGSFVVQSYVVDGFVYLQLPDKTWRKASNTNVMQTQSATALLAAIADERVSMLPDADDHGVRTGTVGIDIVLPASPAFTATGISQAQHMRCSYDKATYRLSVCRTDLVTMTFDAYNDPSNVVVLPSEAKDALPMALGHPVPRHSPALDSDAAATAPPALPSPAPADAASAVPSASPSAAPTP